MLTKLTVPDTGQLAAPKEGDLYKIVNVSGKTFPIYYGYYEDFERYGRYNEPMPIYPDFRLEPQYTENGIPFVTAMQDICSAYCGTSGGDSCEECIHFQKCEELFGLCTFPGNQKHPERQTQNPFQGEKIT